MKRLITLLTLACCMLISTQLWSQEKKDSTYRVETVDGNEYVGKIISRDSSGITLSTAQLGIITIKTDDIKRITPISSISIANGREWFDSPQSTKYFLAPNGYGLKKGEGYYQNVWIFLNQFTYGVTNYFSVGVGIVPLFLFAGAPTPVWINPKFSIPVVKDKVNLGAGMIAGTVIGEEDTGFGIFYGTSTFGSRDRNISVGAGGGFGGDAIITLAGMYRTGPRWYLLTENYLISIDDDPVGIISVGARYASRKIGIDFGLVFPLQQEDFLLAGPWLGINVPFGRARQ